MIRYFAFSRGWSNHDLMGILGLLRPYPSSSFMSTLYNYQNQILQYYIATTPPQENVLVKIEIVDIMPVKVPQIWALAFSKGKTNKTTTAKTKNMSCSRSSGNSQVLESDKYLINPLRKECLATLPVLPNKKREVLVLVKASSSPVQPENATFRLHPLCNL